MAGAKKYEILHGSSATVLGASIYRVRALRAIPEHRVNAGDLGGFVASEYNLSQEGSSWIADDAMAVGRSRVEQNGLLCHHAIASDHALIAGQAKLRQMSRASGHAIIRDTAALGDLAHATGNVTIDGPLTINGGASLSGDDLYRQSTDVPWTFRAQSGIDQDFEEHLLEALSLDQTMIAAFAALGAEEPQQRLSAAVELLSTPDGRTALQAISSRSGGTFHPSAYLPVDAQAISAENAANVIAFCIENSARNYQAICSIHPNAVIACDTGHPWYAGVIRTFTPDKPTRFLPVLLEDANALDTIAALPLRVTPAHGQFTSLLDAEAAAMDRLADLHATPRDRASRPDPVTVFPTKLPTPVTLQRGPKGHRMHVTMNSKHATLHISPDCVAGLDFAEITDSQVFTWRTSLTVAVSNPHHIALELPEPSDELRRAIERATRAQRQKGFIIMKRDMDLVRSLLLEIEANQNINGRFVLSDAVLTNVEDDRAKVQYHLRLLFDAGYIEGRDLLKDEMQRSGTDPTDFLKEHGAPITVERMTWDGHEFLDSVRDNQVWQKTKGYLSKVGGVGIDVLKDVAKAVVKDQINQHTGLNL